MIKAIETAYAGCRFRSRTEARWAVFFDALGLKWVYEKEGFELPSGRYLPDFWLPDLKGGVWVEVKGEAPTEREVSLARDLEIESGFEVSFLCGAPGDHVECSATGKPFDWIMITPSVEAALNAARAARFERGWRQKAIASWFVNVPKARAA